MGEGIGGWGHATRWHRVNSLVATPVPVASQAGTQHAGDRAPRWALAWLVVSALFSWYLGNFANYNVGESVNLRPVASRIAPGGPYEVIKQLPHNGREFEYRIKSAGEEQAGRRRKRPD